ncbi:MAG: hypothetical protein M1419_06735, partial [Bacteroidetes bacterium]|nr:hypothetical protein [Bacteroidota bacterium]
YLCRINATKIKIALIALFVFLTFYHTSSSQNFQLSIYENIFNGDFSKGNTGFFTDYIYSVNDLTLEGNYTITSDPYAIYDVLSPCADHTPGIDSLMMVINGFVFSGYVVWGDSILNVLPNNDYIFSFWAQSCIYRNPARLEVYINGKKLPDMMYLTDTVCKWYYQELVWNSGMNKIAVITIIDTNLEASGNDFAIDDLSFRAICSVQADAGPDVTICEGETTHIGNLPPNGIPPFQYVWQPATGLNDPTIASPTVNVNTSSTFNVTVTDSLGCVAYDTVTITVIPFPQNKIVH